MLGWGRSPGVGNGKPLQYACLENPMDREARQDTVHVVTRVRHHLATKNKKQTKPTESWLPPHSTIHLIQ